MQLSSFVMTLVLAGIKNDESCDSKQTPPQMQPGALGAADDGDVSPEPQSSFAEQTPPQTHPGALGAADGDISPAPQSIFSELEGAVQEDASHSTYYYLTRCCRKHPNSDPNSEESGCGLQENAVWKVQDSTESDPQAPPTDRLEEGLVKKTKSIGVKITPMCCHGFQRNARKMIGNVIAAWSAQNGLEKECKNGYWKEDGAFLMSPLGSHGGKKAAAADPASGPADKEGEDEGPHVGDEVSYKSWGGCKISAVNEDDTVDIACLGLSPFVHVGRDEWELK